MHLKLTATAGKERRVIFRLPEVEICLLWTAVCPEDRPQPQPSDLRGIVDHDTNAEVDWRPSNMKKPPNKASGVYIAKLCAWSPVLYLFIIIYGVFGQFSGFNRLWKNKGLRRSALTRIQREHGKGMKRCKESKWLSVPVFISIREIPAFHLFFFGNKGEALSEREMKRRNVRKKNYGLKKKKSPESEGTQLRSIYSKVPNKNM